MLTSPLLVWMPSNFLYPWTYWNLHFIETYSQVIRQFISGTIKMMVTFTRCASLMLGKGILYSTCNWCIWMILKLAYLASDRLSVWHTGWLSRLGLFWQLMTSCVYCSEKPDNSSGILHKKLSVSISTPRSTPAIIYNLAFIAQSKVITILVASLETVGSYW